MRGRKDRFVYVFLLLVAVAVFIFFNLPFLRREAYVARGNSFFKLQEYGDAEVTYRLGIAERSSVEIQFNLGTTLIKQKRYREALAEFKGSPLGLTDPDILNNAAVAAFKLGDKAFAMQCLKKALLLKAEDRTIRENYLLVARVLDKDLQEGRKKEEEPQNNEANKSTASGKEEKGRSAHQPAGAEQTLSDRTEEELLDQLNVQEEATKGRISQKKQKLYPVSDEYDY